MSNDLLWIKYINVFTNIVYFVDYLLFTQILSTEVYTILSKCVIACIPLPE